MHTPLLLRPRTLVLALTAAGLLTACGSNGDGAEPPPPVVPTAPGITLAGVVAKGAALGNARVVITCATGTQTVTTTASGGYSANLANGVLPCVLKATSSDSATQLHSVAPPSASSSATVNITPLTELVVAQLTGQNPAAFVAAVVANVNTSALGTTATASAVAAAQTALAATLAAGGLNTSTAGDFISGALVAANGTTTGNAHDQVLDALNAQLVAGGSTLAALTETIAANSPVAPPPTPTGNDNATLPADLLLRPKAPNCASLASGGYWLIKLAPSPGNTVTAVDSFELDAPTLTFKNTANPADTFNLAANGNCRYTFPDDTTDDIVVAASGLGVSAVTVGLDDDTVAVAERGKRLVILLVPKQSHSLADLAGVYNGMGWNRDSSGTAFELNAFNVTLGSNGAVSQLKCQGASISVPESSCTTVAAPQLALGTHGAGGFNLNSTNPADPFADRAFAYRAGSGELLVAVLSASGEFNLLTKAHPLALPAVGSVTTHWNVDRRANGLAPDALYSRTHTVVSVTGSTVVRNTSAGSSTVTAPQTLEYNQARSGYLHRLLATVVASDGSTATVRELWAMPLRGFGVTPYYVPATSGVGVNSNAVFGISVKKP